MEVPVSSFRFVYQALRSLSRPLPSSRLPTLLIVKRRFAPSPTHYKKRPPKDHTAQHHAQAPTEDPLDQSTLETSIRYALEQLQSKLQHLRAGGGRFDPALLEALPVTVDKKSSRGTTRLGDVAQVIPKRGRSLSVIVAQEEVRLGGPSKPMAWG